MRTVRVHSASSAGNQQVHIGLIFHKTQQALSIDRFCLVLGNQKSLFCHIKNSCHLMKFNVKSYLCLYCKGYTNTVVILKSTQMYNELHLHIWILWNVCIYVIHYENVCIHARRKMLELRIIM